MKIRNIELNDLAHHINTLITTYNVLTGNKSHDDDTLKTNIKAICLISKIDYANINLSEFDLITYRFASGAYGETYPLTLSVFCRFMGKYIEERNIKMSEENRKQSLALHEHTEERKPIDELIKDHPELKEISDRLNAFIEKGTIV